MDFSWKIYPATTLLMSMLLLLLLRPCAGKYPWRLQSWSPLGGRSPFGGDCHPKFSLFADGRSSSQLLEIDHLSWFDHLSSADSELAAPLGWQKSGLSQDSTLTQILSNGVLALDNANTNKSL